MHIWRELSVIYGFLKSFLYRYALGKKKPKLTVLNILYQRRKRKASGIHVKEIWNDVSRIPR